MPLTLSIDRTSLSLAALVVSTPETGLWLPEEGISRPGMSHRRTYAGTSPWLAGATLVASVLEHSSLPFTLYAQAESAAALDVLMDEVETALFQFVYETTLTEDGVAHVWRCDPADVAWGDFDSGMAHVHLARAVITIPVYPLPVVA
jgi:hypothetical protein